MKNVKCRYANCDRLHISNILPMSEAVLYGKAQYYHKDCYDYSRTIKEIITFYVNEVSSTVVYSHLQKTINTIVFNKNINPHFLLYALQQKKDKINNVNGLHYLVDDKRLYKQWQEKWAKEHSPVNENSFVIAVSSDDEGNFTFVPNVESSFKDILM